jgi:hypothetical protein
VATPVDGLLRFDQFSVGQGSTGSDSPVLGVQVRRTVALVEIDEDFFE